MAQSRYTLVVTGAFALPQLDIGVWCATNAAAKEQAVAIAMGLHGSGYNRFKLYLTAEDDAHVHIGNVRLEAVLKTTFVESGNA
jgi:hypothetical protein